MEPHGLTGRVFGWIMERMNARAYRKTLEASGLDHGHALLEIGFGTGAFLKLAAGRMGAGRICGVDPSALMVETARRDLQRLEGSISVDLRQGDDTTLDWPKDHFDCIVAIHSFQFWSDPARSIAALRELLKPHGLLCLCLREHGAKPPAWLPNPVSRGGNEAAEAGRMLLQHGFERIQDVWRDRNSRLLVGSSSVKGSVCT